LSAGAAIGGGMTGASFIAASVSGRPIKGELAGNGGAAAGAAAGAGAAVAGAAGAAGCCAPAVPTTATAAAKVPASSRLRADMNRRIMVLLPTWEAVAPRHWHQIGRMPPAGFLKVSVRYFVAALQLPIAGYIRRYE
jgi:hypothetical protein